MEDLVLNHIMMRFRTRRTTSSSKCEVDDYTNSKWDRKSVSPVESGETNATHKLPIAPASPVSEVSTSKPAGLLPTESSDDLYGLTPVQTKQSIYEIEHQKPHDASLEKKRSITSVKKLALRLSSRIGPRDLRVSTQGRVLQKARPAAQSTVSISPYASTSADNSSQRSEPSLPTQPTSVTSQGEVPKPAADLKESNGSSPTKTETDVESMPKTELKTEPKALPAPPPHVQAPPDFGLPPEVGLSADHNLARLLPPIQASSDLANSIDEKLTSIQAGSFRPTLNDELEATKLKLTQLFESQALLRERYNSEKDKSSKLDVEHQLTHTRIHSLEQSARDMNDELRRLYEYVGSLERANKELRGGARMSNDGTMYVPHNELVHSVPSTRPVSASPPMSEIQPLRPHPPPIPKKADRRSIRQYDDGSPISRSNSHEPVPTAEDLSYWRVGDITTIAEAGPGSGRGTPRPLWENRRSASMSDDMLRKTNLQYARPAQQAVRPERSSSVRTPLPLVEPKPEFMNSAASVVSSRPEVKGFPQTSYAPVAPTPYAPYSPYEDSAFDLSNQLTPVPTQIRRESVVPVANGGPPRPSTATRTSMNGYRPSSNQTDTTTIDLPNGKARAANGFANGTHFAPSWPEYYMEDQPEPEPTDLRRQSTIKARPPTAQNQAQRASTYPLQGEDLTRKRSPPSVQSSFYSADHGSSADDTYGRSASRAPSVRGKAQTHSSSSGSASRQRKLKLKTSLELLPNCAKKEIALDASRQAAIVGKPVSPTSNFIQNRGFALYRFINPQPVGRDMLSYELERLKPSMSTSKVMISEPTTLRVTFPRAMKGVEGTVGMYDSVSEMWLNPHALKKKR